MKVGTPAVKLSATRTSVPKLGKEVWSLDPLVRGQKIKSYLTVTDYKDWQRADDFINPGTGKPFKSNNFPLIDFNSMIRLLALRQLIQMVSHGIQGFRSILMIFIRWT